MGLQSIAPIWSDVWEFERVLADCELKLDEALETSDVESMSRAATLYCGRCAAGVYDDWILVEQMRLHHALLTLLERVAKFHFQNRHWLQAIISGAPDEYVAKGADVSVATPPVPEEQIGYLKSNPPQ